MSVAKSAAGVEGVDLAIELEQLSFAVTNKLAKSVTDPLPVRADSVDSRGAT